MLAAGIVPLTLAAYFVWRQGEPERRRAALLVALFAPIAACVFLLGWYNHARFGSWTDFGFNYMLPGRHPGRGVPRFCW
jgi:4-amino-4-deoxy-L-arabinose transferase-like glycosyltransferase